MNRKELANRVFDIITSDMAMIGTSEEEIWQSIAETDDASLLTFYEEHKED